MEKCDERQRNKQNCTCSNRQIQWKISHQTYGDTNAKEKGQEQESNFSWMFTYYCHQEYFEFDQNIPNGNKNLNNWLKKKSDDFFRDFYLYSPKFAHKIIESEGNNQIIPNSK